MKQLTPYDIKKLKKKMAKLSKDYDKAEGQPLRLARIEKSAISVQKLLDIYEGGD